ncbi:MAG: RluA family pseudouridine synthase [Candidatus Tectomicrobia bacterium]|nr:RluA family pseudouridine synthase [Candidatus Tectomicrobia bacterium]
MEKSYHTFTVTEGEQGARVDRFLAERLSKVSRSQIQRLMKEGWVTVNGGPAKAGQKLNQNALVACLLPEPKPLTLEGEAIPLNILYEDDSLLVVDKPAGMVVHPGAGNASGTLVNALLHHCKNLSGIGGVYRPGIVHRLDKDTSGLLIVAKDDLSHSRLSAQLKERTLERIYLALVHGRLESEEGMIQAPIGRHHIDRKKMWVTSRGREATTLYRIIERFDASTFIEVRLKTGRTHQIRVHMAYLHYPLVGDRQYGGKGEKLLSRQALHASTLTFIHPLKGTRLSFTSPLPEDIQKALTILRNRKGKNDT